MMRTLLLILVSLANISTIANATDRPWERFLGCYETVEKNGVKVLPDVQWQSKILFTNAKYFLNADKNPIPSVSMRLFYTDEQSSNEYYDVFEAFGQLGTTYEKDEALRFLFSGNLLLKNTFEPTTLFYIQSLSGKEGDPFVRFAHTGDWLLHGEHHYAHSEYLLKRVACQ